MADEVSTSSGVRIFLGPVNTTADSIEDFEALSWTEIEPVQSLGEFGDNSQVVTFAALKDGRMRKSKGTSDAGDLNVVVGANARDPGQIAALAASKTKFSYAVKVVEADAPDANDTDTTSYFLAKVMSFRKNVGEANSIVTRTLVLAIDTEIFEDPSAAVA